MAQKKKRKKAKHKPELVTRQQLASALIEFEREMTERQRDRVTGYLSILNKQVNDQMRGIESRWINTWNGLERRLEFDLQGLVATALAKAFADAGFVRINDVVKRKTKG